MARATPPDDLLPPPSRRAFIVEALETLRRQRGDAGFLHGPILEPSDRFFPDAWEPTAEGVAVLAGRILVHAGLPDLPARVVGFRGERERELDPSGRPRATQHEGTAAWYAGIDEEGRCRFGVDLDGLDESASIVGTMCHEVAHVVRDVHDLVVADRDEEELRTDLTTVFLGFGVLTTNAAYVYRSGGLAGSSFGGNAWSHSSRGYLSVAELAFALAYQVVARARGEERIVTALLGPTQRDCFEAALAELRPDRHRRWPTWLPFVVALAVPVLLFALALAHELMTRPLPCRSARDCGQSRRDRCIDGACVHVCQDDPDCPEGQSCVRHACE